MHYPLGRWSQRFSARFHRWSVCNGASTCGCAGRERCRLLHNEAVCLHGESKQKPGEVDLKTSDAETLRISPMAFPPPTLLQKRELLLRALWFQRLKTCFSKYVGNWSYIGQVLFSQTKLLVWNTSGSFAPKLLFPPPSWGVVFGILWWLMEDS